MATINLESLTVPVPLRREPSGAVRIGASRVLLELVIRAFQSGATPEAIVQSYDTLQLADVYAVISYYLLNPVPIDEYLGERDALAEATRRQIEASQPAQANLRETLLARAKAREQSRAAAG